MIAFHRAFPFRPAFSASAFEFFDPLLPALEEIVSFAVGAASGDGRAWVQMSTTTVSLLPRNPKPKSQNPKPEN